MRLTIFCLIGERKSNGSLIVSALSNSQWLSRFSKCLLASPWLMMGSKHQAAGDVIWITDETKMNRTFHFQLFFTYYKEQNSYSACTDAWWTTYIYESYINQVYSLHHFNVYTLWYHQSTQSSLQSVNLQKKHCSVLFNAWSRNQVDYVAQEELDRLCPSDLGPPGCKQVHQVKSHRIMCKLQTSKPNMLNAGPDSNLQITSTTSTPNQHCQWPVPVSHSTPVQYSITVQYSKVQYGMLVTHDSWLISVMTHEQHGSGLESLSTSQGAWTMASTISLMSLGSGGCHWQMQVGNRIGIGHEASGLLISAKIIVSDSRIMFDWIGDWADSRSPRLWLYSALCAPFKFQIKAMLQQDYSATPIRLQRQHCNTYTLHPCPWHENAKQPIESTACPCQFAHCCCRSNIIKASKRYLARDIVEAEGPDSPGLGWTDRKATPMIQVVLLSWSGLIW